MIRILFASRLVQEKGVDILIESVRVFSLDPELRGKIEWHICSDGDHTGAIQELARTHPNIHYYGKVDQERLRELYRSSDILFMPSRFLEMFGLTALEACTLGLPVCGPKKGGLGDFISEGLVLDESDPVVSFRKILQDCLNDGIPTAVNVSHLSGKHWEENLEKIVGESKSILIIHDYSEKIGGAEYYVSSLHRALQAMGKEVSFFGYNGSTSVWKRRIMFILSLFAFWRYFALTNLLTKFKPDLIWMHSILRYIGPWGILAVRNYTKKHGSRTILCHHDIGLLTAFPQDITDESMIPGDTSLRAFIPPEASSLKKFVSVFKWAYVRIIWYIIPKETTQMVFASFLENHISRQFGKDTQIILFPHRSTVETLSSEEG